jgi:hypothetical protein
MKIETDDAFELAAVNAPGDVEQCGIDPVSHS